MSSRRSFLAALAGAPIALKAQSEPPNVVIILADDWGYGDRKRIPMPHYRKMVEQGVELESYYAASPVCSPSRAALLAGRYPQRMNIPKNEKPGVMDVLRVNSPGGLPADEITIAKLLQRKGYATGGFGKWHLGRPFPAQHGFDTYRGVYVSNDMQPLNEMTESALGQDVFSRQENITTKYTEECADFIRRQKGQSFFSYLATPAPHDPHMPGVWKGKSHLGDYGDVVMEFDNSIRIVWDALVSTGAIDNTLIIVTSDNGPYRRGSAGRQQGRKFTTFNGGIRVPCAVYWKGRVSGGKKVRVMTGAVDWFSTIASACGVIPSTNVPLDGVDLLPLLMGKQREIEDRVLLHFRQGADRELEAVTFSHWKLRLLLDGSMFFPPEFFDLAQDPDESYNLIDEPGNRDLMRKILGLTQRRLQTFPEGTVDLTIRQIQALLSQ